MEHFDIDRARRSDRVIGRIIMLVVVMYFAVMALIFTSGAWAAVAVCAANQAGGQIILTFNERRIAYSTNSTGYTMLGVWSMIGDKTVRIAWSDGGNTVAHVSSFEPCEL